MDLTSQENRFTSGGVTSYVLFVADNETGPLLDNIDTLQEAESHRTATVSIVIPAMNEAANLPHILPYIPVWVNEVILVDGHSTDDTVAVAQHLRPDIRIITQSGHGKGDALRCGFNAATGDMIVMLDADGSMDPKEIPLYIGALLSGADFAKGTRFVQGGNTHDMSFIRYCGNLGLTWLVRLLFGGKYSDLCYGYNAFWRSILPVLALDADGFEIETMINVRALLARFKITEVASIEYKRIHGTSNLHAMRDGWRVLKTIIKERIQRKILLLSYLRREQTSDYPPYHKPTADLLTLKNYVSFDVQKKEA